MNRKTVPTITWNPWNPVAMKNIDPYTESAIEKGASMYSKSCNPVNINPSITVVSNPVRDSCLLPLTMLWWAQVTVAPELNNIVVLSKGTENGSKGVIPLGGQVHPISIAGDRALWKKAQKKEKNSKISETINRMNPIFSPFKVLLVWWPWNVLSRITSLNQKYKQALTHAIPNNNNIKKL